MNFFNSIFETWQFKLLISTILALFSPFKITLAALLMLIFVDNITGTIYALSINKFSSAGLRRGLKKLIIYSICILVVRLAEIGIKPFFETIYLTNSIIAYLILTEALSSLENLTLLGVALPTKLKSFILNQIQVKGLKDLIEEDNVKRDFIQEILEMLDLYFPIIKDYKIRKLLDIKFKEWAQFINVLDSEFLKSSSDNPEILYYRITNLVKATIIRINEKWTQEGIDKECIDSFNTWHKKRLSILLSDIKDICFSTEISNKKKTAIIEMVILFLYKTLTDIQKQELCKDNCFLVNSKLNNSK
jgi:toxin secretion/phage lysis holin